MKLTLLPCLLVAAAVPSGGALEAPSTSPFFAHPTAPPLGTAAATSCRRIETDQESRP
jgi:hypothetical protein